MRLCFNKLLNSDFCLTAFKNIIVFVNVLKSTQLKHRVRECIWFMHFPLTFHKRLLSLFKNDFIISSCFEEKQCAFLHRRSFTTMCVKLDVAACTLLQYHRFHRSIKHL